MTYSWLALDKAELLGPPADSAHGGAHGSTGPRELAATASRLTPAGAAGRVR